MTDWAAAVMLLALGLGCHHRQPFAEPQIFGIFPDRGEADIPTIVAIDGAHFYATVDSAAFLDEPTVHERFTITLGHRPLHNVELVDHNTLRAVIPRGMQIGFHDLVVQTPDGTSAYLPRAYEVRQSPSNKAPTQSAGNGGPHAPSLGANFDTGPLPVDEPSPLVPHHLMDNPLGDDTSAAFTTGFNGQLWLGPNHAASGASGFEWSFTTNHSFESTQLFADFHFYADTTGNTPRNPSANGQRSIGRAQCIAHSSACGPDNEDSASLFSAAIFHDKSWLLIAGGRSQGDLNYIYMADQSSDELAFRYVDLSAALGPNVVSVSAAHVLGNRLYIGFVDRGGNRPTLISLQTAPQGNGLDAIANGTHECVPSSHDACDLHGGSLPALAKSSPVTAIDAMTSFNDRLYLANGGGCVRSTNTNPLSAKHHLEHWRDCTPSHPAFAAAPSWFSGQETARKPRDKAVPGFATFEGSLFFARNTSLGAQLWRCSPESATGDCNSDDWRLVAAGSTDPNTTVLGSSHNSRISMLAAWGSHLYVGFDNTTWGVNIYATPNTLASHAEDFWGQGLCTAGLEGCAGLGGSGLGSGAQIIFDVTTAGPAPFQELFLLVGNGSHPVSLLRLGPSLDAD